MSALIRDQLTESAELGARHVHPRMLSLFKLGGMVSTFTRAEGQYLWDSEGNRFLDLLCGGGVFLLGRNHPAINEALHDVLDASLPNLSVANASVLGGYLAKRLLSLVGPGFEKVLFANSGTEATDLALRFARFTTRRQRVLYLNGAFHGRTYASVSVCGVPEMKEGMDPTMPICTPIEPNDLRQLRRELSRGDVGAFILEPIQGMTLNVLTTEYLQEAEALCRRYGTVLIADEVQCGLGRTGHWFESLAHGIRPDIICVSKGLSGGQVPVSAVIMAEDIYQRVFAGFQSGFNFYSTFAQNNLAMAAGITTIDVAEEIDVRGRSQHLGRLLRNGIEDIASRSDVIASVKGKGLMLGIFFKDTETRPLLRLQQSAMGIGDPASYGATVHMALCNHHKILVQIPAAKVNGIKILPPAILEESDVDYFLGALDEICTGNQVTSGPVATVAKGLAAGAMKSAQKVLPSLMGSAGAALSSLGSAQARGPASFPTGGNGHGNGHGNGFGNGNGNGNGFGNGNGNGNGNGFGNGNGNGNGNGFGNGNGNGTLASTTPAWVESWEAEKKKGQLDSAALNEAEIALTEAYATATIVPGEHVPTCTERTLHKALSAIDSMPAPMRALYKAALRSLDLAARARFGRPFTRLDGEKRLDVIEMIAGSGAAGAGIALYLGMPVKGAHFGRSDYLASVGAPSYDNPVKEPDERWLDQVTPTEALPYDSELEAEVVVVGTGAGGAAIAATLAEAGVAVMLLEEGRFYLRKDFSGPPKDRAERFWRATAMMASVGNVPISFPIGKMVGGTTTINSGTSYRTPDHVLDQWRRERTFPSDFEVENFKPYLDAVAQELQIGPGTVQALGPIAKAVARGADIMGKTHGPLPRNAPSCDGQGVCIFGCPTGAKRSANVSYVPRALMAGAELTTGMKVNRILWDGDRAVGVEAHGTDGYGVPKRLVVKARAVVLACGSIYTPGLLKRNGVDNHWLGRNLSVHPSVGLPALFGQDMAPWRSIPQGYGVHGMVDPRVAFEGFYLPPDMLAAMLPLEGRELTYWMDNQARSGQFGFMVRDPGVGRVTQGPGGEPLIYYSVDKETQVLLQKGMSALAELLIHGGAKEVLVNLGGQKFVRSVAEARKVATASAKIHEFRIVACHPLGTCRMGPSANEGVVDFENRVYGTRGLYVADGSMVPTSLGVNPQVTIMAMATRAGERLAARLNAE